MKWKLLKIRLKGKDYVFERTKNISQQDPTLQLLELFIAPYIAKVTGLNKPNVVWQKVGSFQEIDEH